MPIELALEWSSTDDREAAAWDEAPATVTEDDSRSVDSPFGKRRGGAEAGQWRRPVEQVSTWAEPVVEPQDSVAETWKNLASKADADNDDVFGADGGLLASTAEQSALGTLS